jgi:hypothetical protein
MPHTNPSIYHLLLFISFDIMTHRLEKDMTEYLATKTNQTVSTLKEAVLALVSLAWFGAFIYVIDSLI